MRVEVGKAIRVGPGDIVVIRGQLAVNAKLSRLYVFAREGEVPFSPYVENLVDKLAVSSAKPNMYTPMSMRLDAYRPQRELSFIADIDGWVRIMQEVDRPNDTKALVWIKREINPHLPWKERLKRRWSGMQLPWSSWRSTATSAQ